MNKPIELKITDGKVDDGDWIKFLEVMNQNPLCRKLFVETVGVEKFERLKLLTAALFYELESVQRNHDRLQGENTRLLNQVIGTVAETADGVQVQELGKATDANKVQYAYGLADPKALTPYVVSLKTKKMFRLTWPQLVKLAIDNGVNAGGNQSLIIPAS